MRTTIGRQRLDLTRCRLVGEGGEASIYDIGNGLAAKIFKTADHADYAGNADAQEAARQRIDEHQAKLRAFPSTAPARIVAPASMIEQAGKVTGYTMPLLEPADVLMRYGDRAFRQSVGENAVVALFRDLHALATLAHKAGIVIGDFNDLNVLVHKGQPWLIDADSMQFGGYASRAYTERYLDPRLASINATRPLLVRTYDEDADWFAFSCLLMEALLFVGPFGGVYQPRLAADRVPHAVRSLHGISVFHAEVRYPKPARPWGVLPDDLLEHFRLAFEQRQRGVFPLDLLEQLRWTRCTQCGAEHARALCPSCSTANPAAVHQVKRARGNVVATRVVRAPGPILSARFGPNELRWLAETRGGSAREDGSIVLPARVPAAHRIALRATDTVIGGDGVVTVVGAGGKVTRNVADQVDGRTMFDANDRHVFRVADGALWRDEPTGPARIGAVAAGQTRMWAGPAFGFGLYRIRELTIAFVFDALATGINDGVRLPRIAGQLEDAHAVLSDRLCWFFTRTHELGRTIRRLAVVQRDGQVVATAVAQDEDEAWWDGSAGACAAGDSLFVPTDEGIVRLGVASGVVRALVRFPDTEPFVNAGTHLLVGPDGLYYVDGADIVRLEQR